MNDQGERRRERKERDRTALLLTLVISIITHLAVIPPLVLLFSLSGDDSGDRSRVKVVRLSRSAWLNNRQVQASKIEERQVETPKKDEKQSKDDDIEAPGQVVALPPPKTSMRPDQADYASEFDRKVDQESRSRSQTARFLNPTHKPQTGDPSKKEVPSSSEERPKPIIVRAEQAGGPKGEGRSEQGDGPQPEGSGGGRAAMELAIPEIQQRDRLALRLDSERGLVQNRTYSERLAGRGTELKLRLGPQRADPSDTPDHAPGPEGRQGGSGTPGRGIATITPDLETLERLSGAPANDFLPDVEEDEATFLNTWRWKHAPFFNRIADSIRRQWNPGPAISRRDPTGNVYGFQDRYTLLRVTINREGTIQEINVAESCGVDFLDREAVLAFKRAEPFANPPGRLFGGREQYSFFFGFNVDFQTSPLIQFNWRAAP